MDWTILCQATKGNPSDWEEIVADDWASLDESFVCMALNVQGLVFEGADHYSVEKQGDDTLKIYAWHNDDADWPDGSKWARVTTLRALASDPRPEYGGAINTYQTHEIYAQAGAMPSLQAAYAGNDRVSFQDWSNFDSNARVAPKPGQWVSDALYAAHQKKRSIRSWREWTEGVSPSEIANGKVRDQRAAGNWVLPTGTRTYYHSTVAQAIGAYGAANENLLDVGTGSATNQASGNVGTGGSLVWASSTTSGEPDSAAWPTTGTYRAQMDVTQAGADLTFGLLTQSGNVGGFARVSSDLSTQLQIIAQSQAAFSGTGLFLASVTDPAWTSGSAADRYAIVIASVRVIGHGNQSFTLQLNESDDYTDGPWTAAAAVEANAIFHGFNF